MTSRRLIGLETEYGIHAPSNPRASHVALSIELINAYAADVTEAGDSVAGTEWDYQNESPLVDARGWVLPRSAAHPSQLTDTGEALAYAESAEASLDALGNISGGDPSPAEVSTGVLPPAGSPQWRGDYFVADPNQPQLLMNLVLGNGARFYVDHAHPEYSAPETIGAKRAVLYDVAGDVVARRAAERLSREEGSPEVLLYKNNTDNKSVSYGAHENYLLPRSLPFDDVISGLIPFFVTRQIICGAGRVGIGPTGSREGFQISQRADFFEETVGLETTVRRPIINTRDEPHADADLWRRLHVIIGDSNMSQYSAWLRVGTTALVLDLIESGQAPQITVADPVAALQAISHDPSLTAKVSTNHGPLSALEIQQMYYDAAHSRAVESTEQSQAGVVADTETAELLESWSELLTDLGEDPLKAADRCDWVAKLSLMQSYIRRDQLSWSDPRLALIDLQYHDIRPEKGLYYRLQRASRMRTLFSAEQIEWAVKHPPEETRAWLRGTLVSEHPDLVVGASWEGVLMRPGRVGPKTRISLKDPFQGTRADSEDILRQTSDSAELIAKLRAAAPAR